MLFVIFFLNINLRTICRFNMNGARLWLAVAALQALSVGFTFGYHRRSTHTQTGSKSGWRPVVGSGGLIYSFGAAPLHASPYKMPVPVLDVHQSSSRPNPSRETTKLTSIAQSYKPTTTLRTVPSVPPVNQPINTYHNQYTLSNSPYKYIQNIPLDNSFIRNPHNPFAARPSFSKYPAKIKQPHNALQQLTSIQPVNFAQYQTPKPQDIYGKPLDSYGRPTENKKHLSTTMEIFKPEVFKLPDSDTASQSLSQFVKTAQQQSLLGSQGQIYNPFQQYSFQDAALPSSVLGSFGSFGIQSIRGRDPIFPSTKTTYLPPQPAKQTIFNSFSYNPNYKSTTGHFVSTTPHYRTTANQIHFGPAFGEVKISPTPQTKVSTAPKIDPNAGAKNSFRPSFQDPFVKHYQNELQKVTTYSPLQLTTLANNYYDYNFPQQQNVKSQNIYDQYNVNTIHEFKKQKVVDSVASGINQQSSKYNNPSKTEGTLNSSFGYEVVETTEPDPTYPHSSPTAWAYTLPSYNYNTGKSTEPSLAQQDFQTAFTRPTLTPLPENYDTVTEAIKSYDNSLSYDRQVETQSKRPTGDDFEPIGKHDLQDYYKYPTSSFVEHSTRRTKKPTEATRLTTTIGTTTQVPKETTDIPIETLPTLAPNQYFKRPSNPDTVDKEKIRKRTKVRRRRPIQGNANRNRQNTTRDIVQTTETIQTTDTQDFHTIRPRVRPTKPYQTYPTTPTVTTDLTTSALPTTSPTTPTIVKKKLLQRRPTTTTERIETTTTYIREDSNKESSIMKISHRLPYAKLTTSPYEYKTVEIPDYTHKQDEKDTPTSDVAVSLTDTLRTTAKAGQEFSFHKDMRPIESTFDPEHTFTGVTSQSFKETTQTFTEFSTDTNEDSTTTLRPETTSNTEKVQRQRLRNKYNRPRFSVKDYRSRLSSTTSTTEKSVENTPKVRFPQRRVPYNENSNGESENTTERKKFTPKDPRHKSNETELSEEREKEIHSIRHPPRQKQTAIESGEGVTQKISSRIRNGLRRPRPTEETTETSNSTPVHIKRPLRKKIKDSDIGESVQDITVTETPIYGAKNDITSEKSKSESAIMKIADKKHQDHIEHLFEHSKRVSDLTLAASKDYNKPGMFKTVAANSRRVPSYFTIATDDPILPIEAFFPQLNQRKDS